MDRPLTIAVDFDGCLCEYAFPKIGKQQPFHHQLMSLISNLQKLGHKIVLWTSRGEPTLQEAIDWCRKKGLTFDAVNENPWYEKTSGPSPKLIADYYIDDKALAFGTVDNMMSTIEKLEDLCVC